MKKRTLLPSSSFPSSSLLLFFVIIVVIISIVLIILQLFYIFPWNSSNHHDFPHFQETKKKISLVIVSSLGKNDFPRYVETMKSYQKTQVKFIINCFDKSEEVCNDLDKQIKVNDLTSLVLKSTRMKGAKILFWKHIVTPQLIKDYEYIWLLDGDLIFGLNDYPINKLLSVMKSLNGSIIHPTFIDQSDPKLVSHKSGLDPIKVTCELDIMAPIYSQKAYALLHAEGLMNMDDSVLFKSSWGSTPFDCDLAWKNGLNPCLLVSIYPIIHLDSKTMPNRATRNGSVVPWEQLRKEKQLTGYCEARLSHDDGLESIQDWTKHILQRLPIPLYEI